MHLLQRQFADSSGCKCLHRSRRQGHWLLSSVLSANRFAARSPSVLISYAVHTVNAQGQRLAIGWHWQAFSLFPKCCATSSQVHLNHSTVQLNFHLAQKPVFWAYAGLPSKACTRPPYTDLCLLGWSAWQCVRILRLRGLRLFDSFDHPSLCIKLINDI